jgi:hypothetical protein
MVAYKIIIGGRPRQTEGGIQFVHRTISLDARMILGNAPAIHQRRATVVAGFGHNAHGDS